MNDRDEIEAVKFRLAVVEARQEKSQDELLRWRPWYEAFDIRGLSKAEAREIFPQVPHIATRHGAKVRLLDVDWVLQKLSIKPRPLIEKKEAA
jgi:hypothetical protein